MEDNKYFDEFLRCEIKDSAQEAVPSRDIFNEAWKNRELSEKKYNRKLERMYFYMGKKKIAAVFIGVFMGVSALSFGVSPSVRAAVRTIFGVDNEGNIVEESEDDLGGCSSAISMDDSNKEIIENLLGFNIYFPDKVGEYTPGCNEVAGISVQGVKNKDEKEIMDKIHNASDYNKLNEELSKDYKVDFNVMLVYIKMVGDKEFKGLSIGQEKGDEVKFTDRWKIKEEKDVQGVKCTIAESIGAKGNEVVERGEDGAITGIETDRTIKPTGTEKSQKLVFTYNGIIYTIIGRDENAERNQADEMEFAKDYIDILKTSNR